MRIFYTLKAAKTVVRPLIGPIRYRGILNPNILDPLLSARKRQGTYVTRENRKNNH